MAAKFFENSQKIANISLKKKSLFRAFIYFLKLVVTDPVVCTSNINRERLKREYEISIKR